MATKPPDPCRAHDAEVVLRWIAHHAPARRRDVVAQFSARFAGDARVDRALDLLRRDGSIAIADGAYTATDAGLERAARPAPRLPVLPEPLTPRAGFFCPRVGAPLHVEQCALRHRTRTDNACARDVEGQLVAAGCPVGAEVEQRLEAYRAREVDARHQARKARRAA